jgi:hypothetical protein
MSMSRSLPPPVRRRWNVAGGVEWRRGGQQPGGPAANPPHGPPDGGPGTTGPDWPGRSGRHGASGADDGPPTRPAAGRSRGPPSPVADGQGDPLGGLDDPAGPPDLQRLGRGPTQDRREQSRRGSQPGRQPVHPARVVGFRWCLAAGVVGGRWCVQSLDSAWVWSRRSLAGAGAVAGMVAGVACDQDSGHRTVKGQPAAGLGIQWSSAVDLAAHRVGVAEEAVQVHGHGQLGPHPTRLGQPSGLQLRVWPASGSSNPSTATMPSKVEASHSPRR